MSPDYSVSLPAQRRPSPASALRFHVVDWAACRIAGSDEAEWLHDRAAATQAPVIPALLRRRVTAIGQKAFLAVLRLGARDRARYVLCSRHGEYRRTLRLLEALVAGEPVSPADFSLSVHNALAGVLSIADGNGAGHGAVAAGGDSFGFGLLEAVAALADAADERALLIYFDEPLPEEYVEFNEEREGFAAALLLAPARGQDDDLLLSLEQADERPACRSATAQAGDFIDFLLSGASSRVSRGERAQWRWQRAGA